MGTTKTNILRKKNSTIVSRKKKRSKFNRKNLRAIPASSRRNLTRSDMS